MINDIAQQVVEKLTELGQKLAVAESCTGGQLAAAVTAVPGSSAVFEGGVVSYSDEAKEALLHVSEATLRQNGAVSQQVALEMALGVRDAMRTDYGIGITGIAGPGGGSPDKPVGLVYVAWAGPPEGGGEGTWSNAIRCRFQGDRAQIQQQSVEMALAGLMQRLGLIEL